MKKISVNETNKDDAVDEFSFFLFLSYTCVLKFNFTPQGIKQKNNILNDTPP